MLDTIIVGVDGGPGGRDALALARRLHEVGDGSVVALHVYPVDPLAYRAINPDHEAAVRERARALVRRELQHAGTTAEPLVTSATSPARGLHRIADEIGAELTVIGPSHRGRAGRLALGDTVHAAVEGSNRPVAVARAASDRDDALSVIGVGFDGSPEAELAADWAGRMAQRSSATVRLLCVVEPPASFAPAVSEGTDWHETTPERTAHAQEALDEALAQPLLSGIATGEVVPGHARDELIRLSEEVDLLVLGSRGYGPLRRLLLGATAIAVVDRASAPVVVVPRPAAEARDGALDRTATKTTV